MRYLIIWLLVVIQFISYTSFYIKYVEKCDRINIKYILHTIGLFCNMIISGTVLVEILKN